MAMSRRVVITGMGVVTALGDTLDSILVVAAARARVASGHCPCSIRREFKVHFGGQVPRLGSGGPIRGQGSRGTWIGLPSSRWPPGMSAVEDSGIDFERYPSHTCGVIIGSGIGGLTEFETQHSIMREKGPSRISPFTIPS